MNLDSSRYTRLLILFLAISLFPYLYISFYCNPAADDFSYAVKGRSLHLFTSLLNEYLHWNGRYISNILVLTNPIAFNNFTAYKLMPIILICCILVSFYFFITTTTQVSTNKGIVFSLTLTLLYLYQMPIIAEGIYWYTGAVTYQLASIFSLWYFTSLYLYTTKQLILNNKYIHILLLISLLFITIGYNEIMMIVLISFSTTIYFLAVKNKTEYKNILFYLLLCSITFSSIMFFAPGNSVRASYFSNNHLFLKSTFLSLAQSIRFFFSWASSAPLILLSILYYSFNKKLSSSILIFQKSFYLTPFYSLAFLFLIIVIGAFPPYWSTGILGQHRTINLSYFLFIILWFINLTVLYNKNWFSLTFQNKKLIILMHVLICGSLVFTKNGYNLLADIITEKHKQFNKEMTDRYTIISNSKDTIYFELIKNKPKTLFVLDITTNPDNWQNQVYNTYFNVPKPVMLKENNQSRTIH